MFDESLQLEMIIYFGVQNVKIVYLHAKGRVVEMARGANITKAPKIPCKIFVHSFEVGGR